MRTVLKSARSHGSSMYRAVWRSYRYFLKDGGKEAGKSEEGEHTATPGQERGTHERADAPTATRARSNANRVSA